MQPEPTHDVPLTVIGGYLGAGKTTLLNHLLADPTAPRLAIIVNDFGDLNIDESLIASRDGSAVSLTNGCVCCSLSDALADGLGTLLERDPPPEHIVLEASGVAEPRRVAQYGYLTQGVRLAAIITIADAESVEAQSHDKFVGPLVQSQLHDADLIVLSKTDLVTDERRAAVRQWLSELAPSARVIETHGAGLPTSVLLGEGALAASIIDPVAKTASFYSWSYVSDDVFDVQKVQSVLEGLPISIVRAKGFVKGPDGPLIVQLAGRRVNVDEAHARNSNLNTQLVFIAVIEEIDADTLGRALDACRV